MTWMSINHIVCFDPSRYDISPKVGVLTWFIHPEMGIYSQYSMKYPQKELQNCVVKTEVPWRFWCFWRCGGTPNQALLVVVFLWGNQWSCGTPTSMVDDGYSYLEDMEPQEYDIHIYYNEILVPKQHGNVKYLLIRYTVLTTLSPLTSFEMYVLTPKLCDWQDRSFQPATAGVPCDLPWFQPGTPWWKFCWLDRIHLQPQLGLFGYIWFCLKIGTSHCRHVPD